MRFFLLIFFSCVYNCSFNGELLFTMQSNSATSTSTPVLGCSVVSWDSTKEAPRLRRMGETRRNNVRLIQFHTKFTACLKKNRERERENGYPRLCGFQAMEIDLIPSKQHYFWSDSDSSFYHSRRTMLLFPGIPTRLTDSTMVLLHFRANNTTFGVIPTRVSIIPGEQHYF